MTTPYDPQYGTPPGGPAYGTPPSGPGYGQPVPPGADPYAGGQPGTPGAVPYGGQPGYQGAYPGYPPPPGAPAGPGQPGFAAVNQLPGQPIAAIARKRALRMTLIGLGIFVVGLIITIATYSAASSSGGGTYIVAWGPMIVGVIWVIRGLISMSRASKLR
jgi:hypothetical protein